MLIITSLFFFIIVISILRLNNFLIISNNKFYYTVRDEISSFLYTTKSLFFITNFFSFIRDKILLKNTEKKIISMLLFLNFILKTTLFFIFVLSFVLSIYNIFLIWFSLIIMFLLLFQYILYWEFSNFCYCQSILASKEFDFYVSIYEDADNIYYEQVDIVLYDYDTFCQNHNYMEIKKERKSFYKNKDDYDCLFSRLDLWPTYYKKTTNILQVFTKGSLIINIILSLFIFIIISLL